ncbi:MAG: type II secretion system GspH family protein [Bacteriovoracaceae bacterium]|jgi:prepilin-type N-terminal cleavage/methylation domain-containing protein|nr:type II secretion system GspH family protein [Bacteriovoracaceae bacterium]
MTFNNKGFTLIEILIAITLLAFMVLGITTISSNSIDTKDRVLKEDEVRMQLETALSRLEWDFSHLYSPLYFSIKMQSESEADEENEAYTSFMQKYSNNRRFNSVSYEALPIPKIELEDKSELTFFTIANRRKFQNQKQSNFAWIKYELEDYQNDSQDNETLGIIEGTKVLTRKFLADDVFSPQEFEWDKVKSQQLLTNVESIKFEFWDKEKRKWKENLRTIKNGLNKIDGVKITITWLESEDNPIEIFRVYRPLYPYFESENFYQLKNIKDKDYATGSNSELEE